MFHPMDALQPQPCFAEDELERVLVIPKGL